MHSASHGNPAALATGSSRRLAALETALVFLIFFIAGAWPVPDVNEAHYLAKAKHYWNPAWCAERFLSELGRCPPRLLLDVRLAHPAAAAAGRGLVRAAAHLGLAGLGLAAAERVAGRRRVLRRVHRRAVRHAQRAPPDGRRVDRRRRRGQGLRLRARAVGDRSDRPRALVAGDLVPGRRDGAARDRRRLGDRRGAGGLVGQLAASSLASTHRAAGRLGRAGRGRPRARRHAHLGRRSLDRPPGQPHLCLRAAQPPPLAPGVPPAASRAPSALGRRAGGLGVVRAARRRLWAPTGIRSHGRRPVRDRHADRPGRHHRPRSGSFAVAPLLVSHVRRAGALGRHAAGRRRGRALAGGRIAVVDRRRGAGARGQRDSLRRHARRPAR